MNKRIPTLTIFQKLALCLLIALLFPVVIFFVPSLYSDDVGQQVTLAWDRSSKNDLAGYRVFCREKDQDYDYGAPAWEAEIDEQDKLPNPDEPTCTIYDLDADTTYYFVARAFYTSGNESGDSNEVCITIFSETYEVSGRITEGGEDVDGVTVELTGELAGCGKTNPIITSGGGYYSFDVPDGIYTVTPSSSNYEFTPPSRDVTVSGLDVPNQDFTATFNGLIVIDDTDATFATGATCPDGDPYVEWACYSGTDQEYGTGFWYKDIGDGSGTVTWTVPEAGTYEVYAWWVDASGKWRSQSVPYTINYSGSSDTVWVDQTDGGPGGGKWNQLGTQAYTFNAGDTVVLKDNATDAPLSGGTTWVVGDAIKLERQ